MKSIRINFLLILLSANIARAASADVPAAPTPQITKHFEFDLPLGYPNRGTGYTKVGGTLYIYTNNHNGIIKKPIIVPEGFDPDNKRGWNELYYSMNVENMLECLHSLGYDFIIIDFDEGGNYLEHNSYFLTKVIEYVNTQKVTPEKNIIVGPSMGGLIARYALAYMENVQARPHDTRLFISFDAPQYGANVPLGIQFVSHYWDGRIGGEKATEAYKKLKTPAARQMLLYHIQNSIDAPRLPRPYALRNTFLNNLQSVGEWPQNLRKVAISNGSGTGLKQLKNNYYTRLQPGEAILSFGDPKNGSIYSVAKAVSTGATIEVAVCKTLADPLPDHYSIGSTRPYDNMAGGHHNFNENLEFGSDAGADMHCFIPMYSALAINTNDNNYSAAADPNVMSKTPFDAIYYPLQNQQHALITDQNKQWILNEIMPEYREESTSYLTDKFYAANIQASKEIRLLPGFNTNQEEFRIHIQSFPRCNFSAPELTVEASSGANSEMLTGIENEKESSSGILLYPNPASDKITIDALGKQLQELQLLQADGKLITTVKPNGSSYQMDLSDFDAGMYFIRILNDDQRIIKKIILTH